MEKQEAHLPEMRIVSFILYHKALCEMVEGNIFSRIQKILDIYRNNNYEQSKMDFFEERICYKRSSEESNIWLSGIIIRFSLSYRNVVFHTRALLYIQHVHTRNPDPKNHIKGIKYNLELINGESHPRKSPSSFKILIPHQPANCFI